MFIASHSAFLKKLVQRIMLDRRQGWTGTVTLNVEIPHLQQQMEAFISILSQGNQSFIVCLTQPLEFSVLSILITVLGSEDFLTIETAQIVLKVA